jgi:hypothetical protein
MNKASVKTEALFMDEGIIVVSMKIP